MNTSTNLIWNDIQLFLCVIEQQSFSAAAKALHLGQPTVSRRIQHLEQQFWVPLFLRGKFGAKPTTQALHLVHSAQQMAKWGAEFGRTLQSSEQAAAGVVTIAAPPGIAVENLASFAAILKQQEPNITLEILSSVEHVDLTRGVADIAIRTQAPNDPELIALHTAYAQPVVMASQEYANTVKQPCTWADLDWVSWAGQHINVSPLPMLEKLIPNFTPAFASDDYLTQKAAVEAGLGVNIYNQPLGFEHSHLVEIDIGITLPKFEFYIVCAKSMQRIPRVRVVIEKLIARIDQ